MTMPTMESTTLVTFMLHHLTARKVELLGSWDNFAEAYAMEEDRRRGRGTWSGCHTFRDIICDGDEEGIHEKRAGGLRMGGTYWYFYRIDGDEEFHDPSQETTTACPLMPGQTLNVMEVPFDVERFGSHSRSSSQISLLNVVKTLNPDDRYVNPKPTVKPQPSKLTTSAEAVASARHIFTASSADASRSRLDSGYRKRPWTVHPAGAEGEPSARSRNRTDQRTVKSSPSSPTIPALHVLQTAFELQDQSVQEALTPSQGGRGRSRILRGDGLRRDRSRSSGASRRSRRQSDWPLTMDYAPTEVAETTNYESAFVTQQPLLVRSRVALPHLSVRRVQEVEMAKEAPDMFPAPPERGRSASNMDFNRPRRISHRRGFSSSTSVGRKREPSPLRNLALTQDETRSLDDLAIPSCVPEVETEDIRSPWRVMDGFDFQLHSPEEGLPDSPMLDMAPTHTLFERDPFNRVEGYSPLSFSLTEPLSHTSETEGMQQALRALHDQYTNDRHYSPWRPEFDIPLPESPETSNEAGSGIGSPTFSSIHGDASDTGASHRLSELREWPLRLNDFSGFDFQLDRIPDVNRSLDHLSIRTCGTGSTTSTAVHYQLPNMNPFAQNKAFAEQPQQRELTQAEQLLDEFEYLGAALV